MSVTLALAPICPHITERIYASMGGKKLSVHMEDWSRCDDSLINEGLEHSMALIQKLNSLVAEAREKMGSKKRWPLKALWVRGDTPEVNDAIRVFNDILVQQANIKEADYLEKGQACPIEAEPIPFGEGEFFIDPTITPEIEAEGWGRDLIRRIQQMRKDMKLNVEEYIFCDVKADEHLTSLFKSWESNICKEVRAKQITFTDNPAGEKVVDWEISGSTITVGVSSSKI